MITIKLLDKTELPFPTIQEAIQYIVSNNLLNYSIGDEKEHYTFFGGQLIEFENEEFIGLGNLRFKKNPKDYLTC